MRFPGLDEEEVIPAKTPVAPQRTLRSAKGTPQSLHQPSGKKTTQQQPQQQSQRVTIKINTREKTIGRKKLRVHSPSPAANDVSASFSEVDEDDPLFDPSWDAVTKVILPTFR